MSIRVDLWQKVLVKRSGVEDHAALLVHFETVSAQH